MSKEMPAIEIAEDGKSYKIRRVEFPLRFPNSGVEFELAPTTGEEEDILMDEKLAKNNEQMRRLLANCLRRVGDATFAEPEARLRDEKELALNIVDNLTINDSTFALVMLRRISLMKGDVYKLVDHMCPVCGKGAAPFTAVADLSDLDVRICEPKTEFALPQSGKRVTFRNLLVSDSASLVTMMEKNSESLLSTSLFLRIASVDGKKLSSYRDLKRLTTVDREALREELNNNESGLDLSLTVTCPRGHVEQTMIQPDVSFFLPSLQPTGSR